MKDTFEKQKLYDSYSASFSKGWESYIKIIDLLLGFSGATALVFVASIKVTDWATLPNKEFIVYVFLFSGMAIIFGACWRFASQHFMEYETLGSRYAASNYFDTAEIVPVTTTHKANSALRSFYRFGYRVAPIPMGICLLSSWISIVIVLFPVTPATFEPAANPTLKWGCADKSQRALLPKR